MKIGFFGDGPDLQYQDEIYGSLFIQADRVVELIYLKYFKARISYDGLIRVERYPIPKDAMREAVFNALMHSNYDSGVQIQIRIHEDLVLISNDCVFPANWTAETLMQRHRSEQYNPKIANAFFRAGYVEAWGRGIENMCKLCVDYGVKTEYTVHPCDVMLEFKIPQLDASDKRPEKVTERGTEKVTENQAIIIREMEKDSFITAVSLAKILGISLRKTKENIKKLQQKGLIRRIGPDKGGHWQITEN